MIELCYVNGYDILYDTLAHLIRVVDESINDDGICFPVIDFSHAIQYAVTH
jgi:hypothetical protein